jgi:transforming growth factor-beta-induced protein
LFKPNQNSTPFSLVLTFRLEQNFNATIFFFSQKQILPDHVNGTVNKSKMKNNFRFLFMFCIAASLMGLSSCDDDDDNRPGQNVVQLAQGNDNLSTLEAALVKFPDLVTTLSGSGQVTVFAPTNDAFENLLDAMGQTSLDDIPDDVLREVLEYHVVSGAMHLRRF